MMPRNLFKVAHAREFIWFSPFFSIGLMALALIRPLPQFPAPPRSRTVVGDEGTPVQIAQPFRGVALTYGFQFPNWYLEDTQSPELLAYAGGSDQREWYAGTAMSLVYPQLLQNESLWNPKVFKHAHDKFVEIEALVAYDPGVYLGVASDYSPVPLLRRVGLPALSNWGHQKNGEQSAFSTARIDAALVGHPEFGEQRIATYRQAVADLDEELKPSSLADRPRVLVVGTYSNDRSRIGIVGENNDWERFYFPRAGIVNAAKGWIGQRQDAERILAMDPDIVFLSGAVKFMGQTPQEFMQDSRWLGLKAVRDKRVYRLPGVNDWGPGGLIFTPIRERWLAEIAHPDRLPPKVRQMLRDRLMTDFGYRLTDEQVDSQLRVDENSGSWGSERFTRSLQTKHEQGSSK
jgi:iron complex transport system substrate-binding protein